MKIIVQNSANLPIYYQIYEQIKAAILSQEVAAGELLPSIRQLSHALKVSVITTTRAYNDLEKDGYITTIQGKGSFVQALDRTILEEKMRHDIEEHFHEILKAARMLHQSDEELFTLLKTLLEESHHD